MEFSGVSEAPHRLESEVVPHFHRLPLPEDGRQRPSYTHRGLTGDVDVPVIIHSDADGRGNHISIGELGEA